MSRDEFHLAIKLSIVMSCVFFYGHGTEFVQSCWSDAVCCKLQSMCILSFANTANTAALIPLSALYQALLMHKCLIHIAPSDCKYYAYKYYPQMDILMPEIQNDTLIYHNNESVFAKNLKQQSLFMLSEITILF